MKNMFLLVAAITMAVGASGCGRQCKKARKYVLEPTQSVMSYLQTNPTGEDLALQGCPQMVEDFENIPDGAQNIRRLAERRFADTSRSCLWWERGYRTRCERVYYPGRGRGYYRTHCYSEPYTYCARWQYDRHERPGYRQAMELADNLDDMHDRTHRLCGDASGGRYEDAYAQSRDLLSFMTTKVKPDGDRVYAMACGQ